MRRGFSTSVLFIFYINLCTIQEQQRKEDEETRAQEIRAQEEADSRQLRLQEVNNNYLHYFVFMIFSAVA